MTALLLQDYFFFFLVFSRLLAVILFMPGFGQAEIPGKIKALLTVSLAFCFYQFLPPYASIESYTFLHLFFKIIREFFLGFFIGLTARILFYLLDITGSIISFQINLSNALLFNPSQASQANIISLFLTTAGLAAFFAADLHHFVLLAFLKSFTLFPFDEPLLIGDFSQTIQNLVAKIFYLGTQLAIPFLVIGLILQTAFGFLNKLMPQMHIFFVGMPLQVGLGLFVLMIVSCGLLFTFVKLFQEYFFQIYSALS